jgi:hypothetical protein
MRIWFLVWMTGWIRRFTGLKKLNRIPQRRVHDLNVVAEPPRQQVYNTKKFRPFPFAYHDVLRLTITDITNLGVGIGRYVLEDSSEWVRLSGPVLNSSSTLIRWFKFRTQSPEKK